MSHLLDKVVDVDIDDYGRFKYILINVQDDTNKISKQIVRGNARAQWHGWQQIGSKFDQNPTLESQPSMSTLSFCFGDRICKTYPVNKLSAETEQDLRVQFDVRLSAEIEQNLRIQLDGKLTAKTAQDLRLLLLILYKCNKIDYYRC
ncbi:hypothetical protein EAG_08937 [Camponotus floridanus]|uniref:Uncharacterized protein n=1 Tax=Camponotus floridanus TaxID=104421 RepID=E2AQL6_CAMFO|nr:hypothetical protein EAG_08937 [Camponotus floridanus]